MTPASGRARGRPVGVTLDGHGGLLVADRTSRLDRRGPGVCARRAGCASRGTAVARRGGADPPALPAGLPVSGMILMAYLFSVI